jgi:hypothetical protein
MEIWVLVLLTATGWQETHLRYVTARECLSISSAVTLMPTLCVPNRSR